MTINIDALIFFMFFLFYLVLVLMARILVNKFTTLDKLYQRNHRRLSLILSLISNNFVGTFDSLRAVKEVKQSIIMESTELDLQTDELRRIEAHEIHLLNNHHRPTRRKEASVYLGLIGSKKARIALEDALPKETDYSVKIYISNALTDIHNPDSLPIMIHSLIGTHKWYKERAISNIVEFGDSFMIHLPDLRKSSDIEITELIIQYARENIHPELKKFLFDYIEQYDQLRMDFEEYYVGKKYEKGNHYRVVYLEKDMEHLLEIVCRTLANFYYSDFATDKYFNHNNRVVRINSYWAAAKTMTTVSFQTLLDALHDPGYEKALIGSITQMIDRNPRFIYLVESAFYKATDIRIQTQYAQILSNKIEYYILQLNTKYNENASKILTSIIQNGKINELIGFINRNKNEDLENSLASIIEKLPGDDPILLKEFQTYLKPSFLEKIQLEPILPPPPENVHQKDPKLIRVVIGFTLVAVLMFPVYYVIARYGLLIGASFHTNLKQYVIDFNYYLAFYSIAINLTYIGLLCLSYVNMRKQSKLWNLKNVSMLFRNRMIPSISILAPAFNEEKTIIESVNSLLNLKYPDYELIVINDGSKDDTLNRLINAFELVRVDYYYAHSLVTAPIRGIYRNRSIPKLIVIDKSNGGKADSLNAGINVANKEFFCGIDADSLLEGESLLKLASLTLDESVETPALGGNIFPINGCTVEKGLITKIQLPKNNLARFQTIEYIRAFMAGRLGWQQLNCLLIISGAYGLFRKERVIGIGGYLTSKGRYKKDTVGEDMELVVRISRLMHEAKQHFKILYAFNANCWTEVPEDFKSLQNQRFRWHRGLIDILFFHRKMILNKAYGKTGFIALPYFLVFEAIGPMIEFQGYLMVVLAALLGILDARLALLLFISTILLGMIVSLTSLLIAERENNYFSLKDLLLLVLYALIENFGPRQLFSFWRILGQFRVIFGNPSWGNIKRKGVTQ